MADVCEPLALIGDVAGGDWPERIRRAIASLVCDDGADEGPGLQVLADIRDYSFLRREEEAGKRLIGLPTRDIIADLVGIEDSPWAEYRNGRPLTAYQLGRLLKRYGIRRVTARFDGGEPAKGYLRADFEDAWSRLLPPIPPQKVGNSVTVLISSGFGAVTNPVTDGVTSINGSVTVTDQVTPLLPNGPPGKAHEMGLVTDVTDVTEFPEGAREEAWR
jgi:hypothetical protein